MRVHVLSLSRVRLFATPRTVTCQALLSTGFSRQEYWSGLPFPSPGDLPKPGIEPRSPALQADALPSELLGKAEDKFPDQGSNLGPLHWEHGVLATGPLRKSLVHLLTHMFCLGYFCVLRPGLSQLLGPDVERLTMGAFLTSVFILEVSCRSRPGWACFFFSVHITQHRLDTEKVPVSVGEVNDQKKVGVIIEKEGLAPWRAIVGS